MGGGGGGGSTIDDLAPENMRELANVTCFVAVCGMHGYASAKNGVHGLLGAHIMLFELCTPYSSPIQGLSCEELSNHVRIIQRKIAEMKEELKLQQQGRLDITFPSR